jgi:hypothetical protein
MARRIRYVMDNDSFGEFIMSERMRGVVAEVAADIAKTAKRLANKDNSSKRRVHHYADMFQVNREAGAIKVDRALRVKVEVYNPDPVALYNEFGNVKSKRHRTLGRAGAIFGDFKPEGGPS